MERQRSGNRDARNRRLDFAVGIVDQRYRHLLDTLRIKRRQTEEYPATCIRNQPVKRFIHLKNQFANEANRAPINRHEQKRAHFRQIRFRREPITLISANMPAVMANTEAMPGSRIREKDGRT